MEEELAKLWDEGVRYQQEIFDGCTFLDNQQPSPIRSSYTLDALVECPRSPTPPPTSPTENSKGVDV